MANAFTRRRRWFGAFYLALAGAMLVWGFTWLKHELKGWYFVFYWLACFFFTGLAMIIALLDIRSIRQEIRQDEKELLNNIFSAPSSHKSPPPESKKSSSKTNQRKCN